MVAPVLLRLCLAVIFLWTGFAKVAGEIDVTGERAAILANLGVLTPPRPEPPATSDPAGVPEVPTKALPRLAAVVPSGIPPAPMTYVASDFPSALRVRYMWIVALVVHESAFPKEGEPVWPRRMAEGRWPVVLSYAVPTTQILAGVLLVIGWQARAAALALATFLLTAMWVTEIGPAVQTGTAVLGFLPTYPAFEERPWLHLWLQFSLLCMALSVVVAGAGGVSIDRALKNRRLRKELSDEL